MGDQLVCWPLVKMDYPDAYGWQWSMEDLPMIPTNMTSPEQLKYGDKILVLRHGSRCEVPGIKFSALEHLRTDQENVFEARVTSSPSYFDGFYDLGCKN